MVLPTTREWEGWASCERKEGKGRKKGSCAVGGGPRGSVRKEVLAWEGFPLPHFFFPVFLLSQKTSIYEWDVWEQTFKNNSGLLWKTVWWFLKKLNIELPGLRWCPVVGASHSPGDSDSKESACNAEDPGSIPGLGRSLGEGNGIPLQCSCLENSMDRGAWWATVHGVTESWTQLSD